MARITPCLENGKTAFIDFLDKDEIAFGSTEQIRSVMRGASALVEANIPREQSVFLLQKYWDLRPSEAKKAIWQAEKRAKKG